EENQQTDNQLDPAHLGASESVQGNQRHQQHRLPSAGVSLHIRASLSQNQRFTHGFEQVIPEKEQKNVHRQQQRAPTLTGANIGEIAEELLSAILRRLPYRFELWQALRVPELGPRLIFGAVGEFVVLSHGIDQWQSASTQRCNSVSSLRARDRR